MNEPEETAEAASDEHVEIVIEQFTPDGVNRRKVDALVIRSECPYCGPRVRVARVACAVVLVLTVVAVAWIAVTVSGVSARVDELRVLERLR